MSQFRDGLVSVLNNSAVVNFTGADLTGQAQPGNLFALDGENVWYEIQAINSPTQITLTTPYGGANATNVPYIIHRDFTANLKLPYPGYGDRAVSSLLQRTFSSLDGVLALLGTSNDAFLSTVSDTLTLRKNVTSLPTLASGIVIKRGALPDVKLTWRDDLADPNKIWDFDGKNVGGIGTLTATTVSAGTLTTTTIAADALTIGGTAPALSSVTITGAGLATGGGSLAANRTITVTKSTNAQATAGTDDTTAMTPLRVADAITSRATAAVAAASETVAGKVELATAAETATGTDTTRAVHPAGLKSVLDTRFAALLDAAPATLDTLNELAAALGDDPNFATTIATQIGGKLDNTASVFIGTTAVPVNRASGALTLAGVSIGGNAATATTLATARTIAGVSFNGSANISIPFANLSSIPTTRAGYGITDVPLNNGTGATGTWGIDISGSAANFGGTSAETWAANDLATELISGGGIISVTNDSVKWSARYIVIGMGRATSQFSTGNGFDITLPSVGTVIPGLQGATDKTVTADGIPLGPWEVLYYILPIGANQPSVPTNFRVVGYNSGAITIPKSWIPIVRRNSDSPSNYEFPNGRMLQNGQSLDTGIYGAYRSTRADVLTTARTIAGVSFDGSTNISIPFANLSSRPTTLAGYGITDAPTLTGTGATGTWGIGITGNAATATLTDRVHMTPTLTMTNADTIFTSTPADTQTIIEGANLTGAPTAGWWFYQNMRHSVGTNFWGRQIAWGWQDNAHELYSRNVLSGVFSSWVRFLNSDNFNSYAPTLAGVGATGTWGIDISGSAANFGGVSANTWIATNLAALTLSGGGTISVTNNSVKWTTRYIFMNAGRGAHFAPSGYFQIDVPSVGTVIPGVGGAADKTVTADGIPLIGWETLYYILPINSAASSNPANFRVVGYTTPYVVPQNWIPIVRCNGDAPLNFEFPNGRMLQNNQSLDTNAIGALRASRADVLNTARTIAGVSFNGSANISIPFANLSSKPTTLSGYGITDALSAANTNLTGNTTVAGTLAVGKGTAANYTLDVALPTNSGVAEAIIAGSAQTAGNEVRLYITPIGGTNQNKTAIISEAINSWGRGILHLAVNDVNDASNATKANSVLELTSTTATFKSGVHLYAPILTIYGAGGSEGGELRLVKPPSGTVLTNDISIDINGNLFRVFENGGTSRGFRVDLSTCAAGAASTLWHSSNFDPATKANTNQTMFVGTTSLAINRASAAQTLTGVSIDGNAATATTLATARTIAGVSFNGSANISIPFANLSSKPTTLSGYGITDAEPATGVFHASTYGVAAANTAAANTTALNAAIAAAVAAGGKVILPRGVIRLNALASIVGANSLVLEGQGKFAGGTVLEFQNATGNCITFSGGGHNGIVDCYVTAGVRRTSGYAIVFTGSIFHPICDVRIDYHFDGVFVDGCSESSITAVMRYMYGWNGVRFAGTSSAQTYGGNIRLAADNPYPVNGNGARKTYASGLAVTAGEILWCPTSQIIYQVVTNGSLAATEPSTIGGTGAADGWSTNITSGTAQLRFVSRAMNWIVVTSWAYSIRLNQGTHLLNGYRGVLIEDPSNSEASRPKWVYLNYTETDHSYWNGVEVFRGDGVYICNAWLGSSLTGRGLMVDTGFNGDLSVDAGTRIVGNWLEGVYVGATKNIRIMGATIEENSQVSVGGYNGLMLDGTTRFQVFGVTSKGARQSYGIGLTPTCDYFSVVGNNVGGNNTGGISNGTSASANRREVVANIT